VFTSYYIPEEGGIEATEDKSEEIKLKDGEANAYIIFRILSMSYSSSPVYSHETTCLRLIQSFNTAFKQAGERKDYLPPC